MSSKEVISSMLAIVKSGWPSVTLTGIGFGFFTRGHSVYGRECQMAIMCESTKPRYVEFWLVLNISNLTPIIGASVLHLFYYIVVF